MRIINLENIPVFSGRRAVALGFFDGVHIGHRAVISAAVSYARENGLCAAALTFDRLPANVISGKNAVPLITGNTEKAYRISELEVQELCFAPFEAVKDMPAERFVSEILVNRLHTAAVVCGYDYTFGAGKLGNADTLRALSQKYGFTLTVIPRADSLGNCVSSSRIRSLIENGKISEANALLVRPYSVCSRVETGKQIGRTIGVPTINQRFFEGSVIPQKGVYISVTTVGDSAYPSVSNVGTRPTVDGRGVNIETHIIRQYFELYDKEIRVELFDFIRPEMKFEGLEALRAQIEKDVLLSRKFFSDNFSPLGVLTVSDK